MERDETRGAWTSLVLLEQFQGGDDLAADALFARYVARLTSLARSRLSPRVARRTDPEDIVLSVYRSFFVHAREGRYSLSRGGDLWRLLASIAKHKLLRQVRYQTADRRSVDVEVPLDPSVEGELFAREQESSPEEALALADELECVLAQLNAFGRRVLELRLQGLQLSEIAEDTGRSERTVRRTLDQIRKLMAARRDQIEEKLADSRPVAWPAMRTGSPPAPPPADPDFPLLSHQDVLLQRLIGAGKMGKVYQAWHKSANREVAVKFLRRSFLDQPRVVQRFIGEARTIARLRHPNIVGTQGLGRTTGGAYFIVMDLVSGPNLDQVSRTRPILIDEAVRWAIETCDALEHAHEEGIIHCDLKPANLLLDGCGRIRVTDFGLARSLTEHMPWTAEVEGTAPFMAPEQVSRCWGPIDERTDVYGIGAVLYTLLTGRAPWIGRRLADILAAVVSAAPVVPPVVLRPELSRQSSEVCLKCLSKAPGHRYATVRDLRSILTGLLVRS
jgi:RNA polymerase sigma factor (sigma-70 family)